MCRLIEKSLVFSDIFCQQCPNWIWKYENFIVTYIFQWQGIERTLPVTVLYRIVNGIYTEVIGAILKNEITL